VTFGDSGFVNMALRTHLRVVGPAGRGMPAG
jgi:hypothetical protein